MGSGELVMGLLFLFQPGAGLLGNSSLLYLYILTSFTKHTQRPTDLILNPLTFANFLVLFSRGLPQTLDAFDWKYFLGEVVFRSQSGLEGAGVLSAPSASRAASRPSPSALVTPGGPNSNVKLLHLFNPPVPCVGFFIS